MRDGSETGAPPAVGLDAFADELRAGGVTLLRGEDEARHVFVPQIRWERIDAASFDRRGRAVASTPGFPVLDVAELAADFTAASATLVPFARSGVQSLVAVAGAATAKSWRLPDAARAVLDAPNAALVAVSAAQIRSTDAVLEACAHLGLSPLQGRVVAALVRHGDLERSAKAEGIAYATAREALALAMERTGAKRRSALIDRVVAMAFGIVPPSGGKGRDLLRDAWGLTFRQAALAVALAQGASREEAARSVSISAAAAKKELANIFIALGVSTATELSALLSEAAALETLMQVTRGTMAISADHNEPLRFVARPSGGMIAFSDYGPRGGRPVLVLHSSSASRPAPSKLVATLQEHGFRPFAIDRPGFGLTDPIAGADDPFAAACDDVRAVCAHLRFKRIDLIARGAAQVAMHLAAQSPELMERVVMLAPDPSSRVSKPGWGVLGTIKVAFRSNPALIEPLARMMVATLTASNVRDLVLKTVRSSPPDVAVMNDPRNLADYYRGFQMFLSGRIAGYVREQAALVTAPDPPANPGARHWHVLIGKHDPLHDTADVEAYWRTLLPNAQFATLPDAGRFIVMSHADLVVRLLKDTPSR